MAKKKKKLMTVKEIEAIKERDVSSKEKAKNREETKKNTKVRYVIPLIIAVIFGFAYLFTRILFLLAFVFVAGFICMFGWDGSNRSCPNCKKWNSVVWMKSEKLKRTRKITKTVEKEEKHKMLKMVFARKKLKGKQYQDIEETKVEKIKKEHGKCLNCGHEFTNEKPILF